MQHDFEIFNEDYKALKEKFEKEMAAFDASQESLKSKFENSGIPYDQYVEALKEGLISQNERLHSRDFEAKKYALDIASRNQVFETLPTAKKIYKWLIK